MILILAIGIIMSYKILEFLLIIDNFNIIE